MIKAKYAAIAVCWSLCASVLLAQPVAVITGPSSAPPGELVVLTSEKSVGDNYLWIIPEDKAQAASGCTAVDSKVFFATAVPGTYQFVLVVADKEAKMSYAVHHVTILGNATPGPGPGPGPGPSPGPSPDPTPDPQPDPKPEPEPGFGRYENLFKTSKMNSEQLKDPTTRTALYEALDKVVSQLKVQCDSNACPTLDEARNRVNQTIENVLLARQGASRDVAWAAGWRVPNNQWLSQEDPKTTQAYVQAMMALTAGLK